MNSGTLNLQMIGRFGNCMFQYAHGRSVAERDGLEFRCPRWIGEKIFAGVSETPEPDYSVDFCRGYHQNQESAIYTLTQVREWFRFRPEIEAVLKPLAGMEIVAHRRVGDLEGYGYPVVSLQSFYNACHAFALPVSEMCFVSEELPTTVAALPKELEFVADFYIMATAKTLLRANSSFSFWSGALNPNRVFSPVIDGLTGGEQLVGFVEGNWPRLASLEGITDIHLKP